MVMGDDGGVLVKGRVPEVCPEFRGVFVFGPCPLSSGP